MMLVIRATGIPGKAVLVVDNNCNFTIIVVFVAVITTSIVFFIGIFFLASIKISISNTAVTLSCYHYLQYNCSFSLY